MILKNVLKLCHSKVSLTTTIRPMQSKTLNSFLDANKSNALTTVPNADFFGRVLERFPKSGRCLSFTYGSAVFQQLNASVQDKVTDFILVVEDPESWHKENISRNKADYSRLLRTFGAKFIADNQDKWGARLHFNTLVPFENGLIKYGVISRNAFLTDCLDWEHLYASGRLHKPVRMLEVDLESDVEMSMALRVNLQSALHTALLLLPENFTEENLYLKLAGLSYAGDFRMIIGEDKNKVGNIVKPNLSHFRKLYANRLKTISDYLEIHPSRGTCEQDATPSGRHYHLCQLPRALQWNLVLEWTRDGRYRDVEEVLRAAAYDKDSDDLIMKALHRIVQRSSITQAVKGVMTAGVCKTIRYSSAKLSKMIKGMRRRS